jgi:hypothetical protein
MQRNAAFGHRSSYAHQTLLTVVVEHGIDEYGAEPIDSFMHIARLPHDSYGGFDKYQGKARLLGIFNASLNKTCQNVKHELLYRYTVVSKASLCVVRQSSSVQRRFIHHFGARRSSPNRILNASIAATRPYRDSCLVAVGLPVRLLS